MERAVLRVALVFPIGAVGLNAAIAAAEQAVSKRDELPEFQIIPAAKAEPLTPANGWPQMTVFANGSVHLTDLPRSDIRRSIR